ncbi:putative repeat protein (TIGR01451 family) [Deinococcus metalli]|uniref:Putative repeat protein (TIGR01451 family) n=1 Tax=Deinococcus metalli TaxID=1141878 RepID=A0A7W8KFF5_9DEIO|nr:DUF11 domain-containing protein [Deinococcus metalli]MBB5376118.1 putative repeat protein (TIGR01451 family) [Deinococcus metalli]GHF40666.1 hypothetical protein GCM10017781_16650 [Deinococcus metalli]
MSPLRPHTVLRAVLAALAFPALAGAAGTPAGTAIRNQASTTFSPPGASDQVQVDSNAVVTTVQAVCAVSVSPDGTAARPARVQAVRAGESAVFAYTVVNAGNAAQTFALSGTVGADSTVTPPLRLVLDANGNGHPDAGEPDVRAVTLDADATAAVLLVTGGSGPGDAWVNVGAACPGGPEDTDNVSQLHVGPPADLALGKTFTPAVLSPGQETAVALRAVNGGAGDSRALVLADDLSAQAAAGLVFVPGSAAASRGSVEYSPDGVTWSAQEITPVRAVRVRVDSLAPGETLRVDFRMRAQAAAENHVIANTVTLSDGDAPLSATASADVRYTPAVALGPVGNAQASELGPDDGQSRPLAALGQTVCFDHTLLNTGDVRDAYTVTVDVAGATVTLLSADGAPLAQPVGLDPGQSAPVRVCYVPTQAGALAATVTATGARGPYNATRDVIARVEAQLPQLEKSAVATTTAPDGKAVTIPEGGTVTEGDTITYTLRVHNPYARALSGVALRDAVPAHVDVTDAGGGSVSGVPGQQVVEWTLAALDAGETRAVTLVTRVSARATDGEALLNTFTFRSAELPGTLESNRVSTAVWSARLAITKTVSATEATYGDVLTYTLQITNASATTDIRDAVITDSPVAGLAYVPGTSALDGAALADPDPAGNTLRWHVPLLAAGKTVALTYHMRVTPAASGDLVNVVEVTGTGGGGTARAVASNRATAVTKLNVLRFAPLSDIVGTVYVDRNRNGRFDAGLDTPVPRARILLAGGRQAITDDQGRYSFLNVPSGTQALRLDPGTTPYPPLNVARGGGLSGTQTVTVSGLTGVDFPLAPLGGDISALRRTTLRMGDVRVEKTVYAVDGGYAVTLTVRTPRPLTGVSLVDPLPAGAVLKDGGQTYAGTLPAGDTTLTYTFAWSGDPRNATTDPTLTWTP